MQNIEVYHEFHVARARCLGARSGDLLREVGSGEDLLGQRDPIVLEEDELESPSNDRVRIHHAAHRGNQLDDQLRHVVSGRRLHAMCTSKCYLLTATNWRYEF